MATDRHILCKQCGKPILKQLYDDHHCHAGWQTIDGCDLEPDDIAVFCNEHCRWLGKGSHRTWHVFSATQHPTHYYRVGPTPYKNHDKGFVISQSVDS